MWHVNLYSVQQQIYNSQYLQIGLCNIYAQGINGTSEIVQCFCSNADIEKVMKLNCFDATAQLNSISFLQQVRHISHLVICTFLMPLSTCTTSHALNHSKDLCNRPGAHSDAGKVFVVQSSDGTLD